MSRATPTAAVALSAAATTVALAIGHSLELFWPLYLGATLAIGGAITGVWWYRTFPTPARLLVATVIVGSNMVVAIVAVTLAFAAHAFSGTPPWP